MSTNTSSERVIAVKGSRRVEIVDELIDLLAGDLVKKIDYRQSSERRLKLYMYDHLTRRMAKIHRDKFRLSDEAADQKADAAVVFEQIPAHTLSNFQFMGTQHRPDFAVHIDDMAIAVEVKRGETGSAVREGIGQSVVYASEYDFIVYVFVDTSKDGKIKRGCGGGRERFIIDSLWENYNIRFGVVA